NVGKVFGVCVCVLRQTAAEVRVCVCVSSDRKHQRCVCVCVCVNSRGESCGLLVGVCAVVVLKGAESSVNSTLHRGQLYTAQGSTLHCTGVNSTPHRGQLYTAQGS